MSKIKTIHLVLYANGEPFTSTKEKLIKSIGENTNYSVKVHDYTLETIRENFWFQYIEKLPLISFEGKRDGYYNCWKPFIVLDVFSKMDENDVLYYVDCSRHYPTGFTQSIDRLILMSERLGCVAGSCGNDVRNTSFGCCDNIKVWNIILPNQNNRILLDTMHVLNSWFTFCKNELNYRFLYDWAMYSMYTDDKIPVPLAVLSHTVDQSIFNILVHKYNLPVFYNKGISHSENKNRNRVLETLNNTHKMKKFFIFLKDTF